jgi:hypothetical protein
MAWHGVEVRYIGKIQSTWNQVFASLPPLIFRKLPIVPPTSTVRQFLPPRKNLPCAYPLNKIVDHLFRHTFVHYGVNPNAGNMRDKRDFQGEKNLKHRHGGQLSKKGRKQ